MQKEKNSEIRIFKRCVCFFFSDLRKLITKYDATEVVKLIKRSFQIGKILNPRKGLQHGIKESLKVFPDVNWKLLVIPQMESLMLKFHDENFQKLWDALPADELLDIAIEGVSFARILHIARLSLALENDDDFHDIDVNAKPGDSVDSGNTDEDKLQKIMKSMSAEQLARFKVYQENASLPTKDLVIAAECFAQNTNPPVPNSFVCFCRHG